MPEPGKRRGLDSVKLKNVSENTAREAVKSETRNANFLMALAAICIIGGIALIVLNFTGVTDISVSFPGASAELQKASPGLAICILGIGLAFASRIAVDIRDTK